MRRVILTFALVILAGTTVLAQRFAYVDTEYILKHIPEYVSAQKQLDALSKQWQKEIDDRYAEIDRLYKAYQADQVLLTPEMRKNRENEIVEKEKEVKELQRNRFGYEGDLYKERVRLTQPIQDRVAKAVQAVADGQQLDMVFDKNSQIMLLYANPRLDKSNDVITRLGYKPGSFAK
jgi:outer membrane protein